MYRRGRYICINAFKLKECLSLCMYIHFNPLTHAVYSAFHQDCPLLKSLYNSHANGYYMIFEAAELENDVRNVIECS